MIDPRPGFALLAGLLLLTAPAAAYETDQYSNRLVVIADSQEVLDAKVNEELAELAERWQTQRDGRDEEAVADAVWRRLGGLHWVDRIERFAARSPEVEKLPQLRRRSLYRRVSFRSSRVTRVFGVGRTFRLAGSLVGSDKLGHFFSQGRKYYLRYRFHASEEKALRQGARAEGCIFGAFFTGIYSNADLIANYEGYLFYRSLFEDEVIPGKKAIFQWQEDAAGKTRLIFQRPFTWADHVNDAWDEAANPSYLLRAMGREMKPLLEELCPDYHRRPEAYLPQNEKALEERYRHLPGLRPAPQWRMDRICKP